MDVIIDKAFNIYASFLYILLPTAFAIYTFKFSILREGAKKF